MADRRAALVWLRRDLRLADHPAMQAALAEAATVVPVFCIDDRLLTGRHASASRVAFMLECLHDLRAAMKARGGGLVIRHGAPHREIPRLAAEVGAVRVHFSFDVGEFARRRDGLVQRELQAAGVELVAHPGVFAMDNPQALRTAAGTPYTVFSPFHRAWQARRRRPVGPAPERLPPLPSRVPTGRIPSLDALGLTPEVSEPLRGGETVARAAAADWLSGPVNGYAEGHDDLGRDGVSRLSPYLRFGCLSARELEQRLGDSGGERGYARQLAWRDFYGYVLHHFPANGRQEFRVRYRGTIAWREDEAAFTAWQAGRTGYPLIDAGMRQLMTEGWMHNRARLVVGSFLTKDLGIDWRRGEAHFMRHLLDGDPASNNGNWQWIASTGNDPAPVHRRILSPIRQQQRFDPDGRYVRRYVPELATVPDRYLAEPWTMPPEVQERCGTRIGSDYPAPIVDHALARREALERYRVGG